MKPLLKEIAKMMTYQLLPGNNNTSIPFLCLCEDKNTNFFSPAITLSTVWNRCEVVLKLYIHNSGDVIKQFESVSLNFHSIPEWYCMCIYLIETAYELTIINSYNVYEINLRTIWVEYQEPNQAPRSSNKQNKSKHEISNVLGSHFKSLVKTKPKQTKATENIFMKKKLYITYLVFNSFHFLRRSFVQSCNDSCYVRSHVLNCMQILPANHLKT